MLEEFDENQLNKLLSSFSCPSNLDVQDFLLNRAIRFEQSDNARTYLILSEDTGEIVAYFSLSFKELLFKSFKVSKTKIKALDGISKNTKSIRTFLIGQIGKNYSSKNNEIHLKHIMAIIWSVIDDVRSLIGGRVVILECLDIPKLVDAYQKEGFTMFCNEDPKTELLTLYIIIKS